VAVIETAKRQGVSHFVYSSVGSADEETGIPHFESKVKVEEHLRSSGLQYTIVRPVFFMELAERVRRVDPERAAPIDGWKRTGTRLLLRPLAHIHFGYGFFRWR
jgi:uncharacterized protein YbjT (DUF2867 family)